jgi:uncharacterized protein (TIGR00661 family)
VNIYYGICGEGMGHAGRSIALIERLIALGHRVKIFTFANAFELLVTSGYQPRRISGVQWGLTSGGGVSPLQSVGKLYRFLRRRSESVDLIRQLALSDPPDLFITDFEPLTALAASSLEIPCVSVDNQHRFCAPLGRDFPLHLRVYAQLAGQFVQRWIHRPKQCIVAVFHACPPSRHYQRVDVLLRDRMARLQPSDGEHVLLYGRGELGRRMSQIASAVPARFVAYGFEGVRAANIEYKQTSYDGFARDLASCKAVLCTAGQQLMGEARYFGKPLLVVPMPGQYEQQINARYARQLGIGDYCSIRQLSKDRIQAFLQRRFADRQAANGVDQVLELLEIGNGRNDAQASA